MLDREQLIQDQKRERARNLRYKKPLVTDINYEGIIQQFYDMREACGEVDIWDRDQIEEAIGDEEDADHFIMEFSMLDGDLERAITDMTDWQSITQDEYDLCLVAADAGNGVKYMGYDAYEEDYFGLDGYESEAAVKESRERLKRKTKDEIIEMFHQSIRILALFETIKYRFDCLQTAIETVRGNTLVSKQQLEELQEIYEECNREGWFEWKACCRKFDKALDGLPPEVWLK